MYKQVLSKDDAINLSGLLKNGNWMILYYAEWCGHCQTMKPEWQKVVSNMQKSGKINLADVKSDFIEDLPYKPQVDGYPTIKMYNSGKEIAKFEDDRNAEKIEQFALNNLNTNTKDNISITEIQDLDSVNSNLPIIPIAKLVKQKSMQKSMQKQIKKITRSKQETHSKQSARKKGANKGAKKSNNKTKKTNKKIFEKLIKSFEKIEDEAHKDSKILHNATHKL